MKFLKSKKIKKEKTRKTHHDLFSQQNQLTGSDPKKLVIERKGN